jgi:hypothetical protein
MIKNIRGGLFERGEASFYSLKVLSAIRSKKKIMLKILMREVDNFLSEAGK